MRGRRAQVLVAALLCAAAARALRSADAAAHIRGVRPELADKYAPTDGGKFTCLDGSKTLDFGAVNDNFCHCADGSDEPGTSACSNGVFYCRNRGHEARLMSTAFVDDGVCDCCDGSDELEGCTNTCIEKNAAVREGLKKQVDDYKAALAKRAEYASGAAAARAEMRKKLAGIDGEIEAAEKAAEQRGADKAALEASADARRAARAERRKAEAAERARKAAEEEAARKAAEAAAAKDGADQQQQQDAGSGADGAAAQQQQQQQQETDEERGRRIASQWTKDPEAAGAAAASAASAASAAPAGDAAKKPAPSGDAATSGWLASTWSKLRSAVGKDGGGGGNDDGGDGAADDDWDAATCEEPTCYESEAPDAAGGGGGLVDKPDGGSGSAAAAEEPDRDTELDDAIGALAAAEEKVAALRAEKELLGRQVGYDYGADDAWLALRRHCSEAREPQYSYRLCLFDKAAQVDNNAGHETNLGAWRGFEKGYTVGVFDGGDWCHQAPARSMRVRFVCGLQEAAWGASEPSTCAYAAEMSTPAACRADDLRALEDRLKALEEEEAALAKEIAEEEAERRAAFKAAAAAAAAHEEL